MIPINTYLPVIVEPMVQLSVLDHFTRREENQDRVVGALLGVRVDDAFIIQNCFPMHYSESDDDQIILDADYLEQLRTLHYRANPKEVVLGW